MDRYLLAQPVRIEWTDEGVLDEPLDPTAQVLTLRRPDETDATFPSPATTGTGEFYQLLGASDLTQTGQYRWKVVATGTGAGVAAGAFTVADPFLLPLWEPTLPTLAALVPTRTVDQTSDDPQLAGSFTDDTVPTAPQASGLIAAAVAWVSAKVGTVLPQFNALAESATAMRAAAMVLTAYPYGDAEADRVAAERWLTLAEAVRADLEAANDALSPTPGPGDTAQLVGASAFPDPPEWAEGWLA